MGKHHKRRGPNPLWRMVLLYYGFDTYLPPRQQRETARSDYAGTDERT